MTLREWVDANGGRGSGIITQLMRESGVSFMSIGRVLKGGRVRERDIARALSRATSRQVTVRELMQLSMEDCAPPIVARRRRSKKLGLTG